MAEILARVNRERVPSPAQRAGAALAREAPARPTPIAARVRPGEAGRPASQTAPVACRVIAITSGKGGVGKSNITANLAIAIGRLGKRVLALDADLGLANLDVIFGVRPTHTLYHVFKGTRALGDVVLSGAPGVQFIAGGSGIRELADLEEGPRTRFLSELKEMESRLDVVLIDTGAGLNSNVVSFLAAAGEVLVVTTPEPTAMADAYGIIKTLAADTDPVPRIWIVVNRVRGPEEGALVAGRLYKVSKQFLGLGVHYAGCLMDDASVPKAVKAQRPFTLLYPNCDAAAGVANLVSRIFGVDVPRPSSSGLRALVARVAGLLLG